ncbi:hypothetical protein [Flavihumibacter sp. ZG627]|uniref:hypothetical protein n=1 Tax=Flavihumibacter sp. ZG627 TaxID=1463156 RepID=UPI00058295A6|nr:hypothetical protein [Flavihumibacter sp. ZG627]KIC92580.1 hypothetical protein HY58_03365 [Flavihumibacter sp. ZG627]
MTDFIPWIPDFIFNIISIVCTALAIILPMRWKISERDVNIKNPKVVSILFCTIIVLLSGFCKDINAQRESNLKESLEIQHRIASDSTLKARDSIHKIELAKAQAETLRNFAEGFARYGLKYDSTKNEISALIRDSAIRNDNYYDQTPPYFGFAPHVGHEMLDSNGSDYFKFDVLAKFAAVHVVESRLDALVRDQFGYHYRGNMVLYKNEVFPVDQQHEKIFLIKRIQNQPRWNYYFHLSGEYTSLDKKKKYTMNDLYMYDVFEKAYHRPDPSTKQEILTILNNYK